MRSEGPGENHSVENHSIEDATRDARANSNAGSESSQSVATDSVADHDEQRKLRRLQVMMDVVMSVISQDGRLTVEQAAEIVADSKKAALAMFPDKELAYNLIYKPRLQRLMRERFRIQ